MPDLQTRARQAIALLDLTNLDDNCTHADIESLSARANTVFGHVAALCVYPSFIESARKGLEKLPVKIATVANFPDGSANTKRVAMETAQAFAEGADEVDVVIAYRAILGGEYKKAASVVIAANQQKPKGKILKVILETGELKSDELIRMACRIALENGADFLKTSTGKVPINATLHSARLLLEEIKASTRTVGFKAAGGIKTTTDAANYLDLIDEVMGEEWAMPATFRFGASSMLEDLIAVASGGSPLAAKAAGY
jgi:deoxyribose-phosphate aldolase